MRFVPFWQHGILGAIIPDPLFAPAEATCLRKQGAARRFPRRFRALVSRSDDEGCSGLVSYGDYRMAGQFGALVTVSAYVDALEFSGLLSTTYTEALLAAIHELLPPTSRISHVGALLVGGR